MKSKNKLKQEMEWVRLGTAIGKLDHRSSFGATYKEVLLF